MRLIRLTLPLFTCTRTLFSNLLLVRFFILFSLLICSLASLFSLFVGLCLTYDRIQLVYCQFVYIDILSLDTKFVDVFFLRSLLFFAVLVSCRSLRSFTFNFFLLLLRSFEQHFFILVKRIEWMLNMFAIHTVLHRFVRSFKSIRAFPFSHSLSKFVSFFFRFSLLFGGRFFW